MPLKLITLNIEGHRHLDKWLPVMRAEQPDVLCLQEVFAVDIPRIQSELGLEIKFVPNMNVTHQTKYNLTPHGLIGLGYCHNPQTVQVLNHQVQYYGGDPDMLKVFTQPNDDNRFVLSARVEKEGEQFVIGTTHFTWSPGGEISDLQRADFAKLAQIIRSFKELVLCGDFNAPRGREMFTLFEELLIDHLPQEVTTTIDGSLHYAGDLQVVVDTIFSTPGYAVRNVRTISGISDHIAIVGEIEREVR